MIIKGRYIGISSVYDGFNEYKKYIDNSVANLGEGKEYKHAETPSDKYWILYEVKNDTYKAVWQCDEEVDRVYESLSEEERNIMAYIRELMMPSVCIETDDGISAISRYELLFKSKYFVMDATYMHDTYKSKYEFVQDIKLRCDVLKEQVANARIEGLKYKKKPLILCKNIDAVKYLAFSMEDRKLDLVTDYKAFKDSFKISDIFDIDWAEGSSDYTVYTFPEAAISALGFRLNSESWMRLTKFDEWHKQPLIKIRKDLIEKAKYYNELDAELVYRKAAEFINHFHREKVENMELYVRLEERFERFVKLLELVAPDEIVEKSIHLIKSSIDDIESQEKGVE